MSGFRGMETLNKLKGEKCDEPQPRFRTKTVSCFRRVLCGRRGHRGAKWSAKRARFLGFRRSTVTKRQIAFCKKFVSESIEALRSTQLARRTVPIERGPVALFVPSTRVPRRSQQLSFIEEDRQQRKSPECGAASDDRAWITAILRPVDGRLHTATSRSSPDQEINVINFFRE